MVVKSSSRKSRHIGNQNPLKVKKVILRHMRKINKCITIKHYAASLDTSYIYDCVVSLLQVCSEYVVCVLRVCDEVYEIITNVTNFTCQYRTQIAVHSRHTRVTSLRHIFTSLLRGLSPSPTFTR